MNVKKESEKAGLKLNIQETKITASGPITSWQIEGGKNGNSDRFYLPFPVELFAAAPNEGTARNAIVRHPLQHHEVYCQDTLL